MKKFVTKRPKKIKTRKNVVENVYPIKETVNQIAEGYLRYDTGVVAVSVAGDSIVLYVEDSFKDKEFPKTVNGNKIHIEKNNMFCRGFLPIMRTGRTKCTN